METPVAPVEDLQLGTKDWSTHHRPAVRCQHTTLNTAAELQRERLQISLWKKNLTFDFLFLICLSIISGTDFEGTLL